MPHGLHDYLKQIETETPQVQGLIKELVKVTGILELLIA